MQGGTRKEVKITDRSGVRIYANGKSYKALLTCGKEQYNRNKEKLPEVKVNETTQDIVKIEIDDSNLDSLEATTDKVIEILNQEKIKSREEINHLSQYEIFKIDLRTHGIQTAYVSPGKTVWRLGRNELSEIWIADISIPKDQYLLIKESLPKDLGVETHSDSVYLACAYSTKTDFVPYLYEQAVRTGSDLKVFENTVYHTYEMMTKKLAEISVVLESVNSEYKIYQRDLRIYGERLDYISQDRVRWECFRDSTGIWQANTYFPEEKVEAVKNKLYEKGDICIMRDKINKNSNVIYSVKRRNVFVPLEYERGLKQEDKKYITYQKMVQRLDQISSILSPSDLDLQYQLYQKDRIDPETRDSYITKNGVKWETYRDNAKAWQARTYYPLDKFELIRDKFKNENPDVLSIELSERSPFSSFEASVDEKVVELTYLPSGRNDFLPLVYEDRENREDHDNKSNAGKVYRTYNTMAQRLEEISKGLVGTEN